MQQTRQLAAILFADIQGYTAMMQKDEAHAMLLKDKFKNKLESELQSHGGRLIKFSGDGALCSFRSAYEAVKAAISTQLHMLQDPIIPIRMGIHQADVVFDDVDVYGDGVNIASRLESMAEPGSIFVSGKVIDDIKNHNDIQYTSFGKYVLKNVQEPFDVYAISNEGLRVPTDTILGGKAEKYVDRTAIRKNRKKIAFVALGLLLLATAGYSVIRPWRNKQHAKNDLIPAIQKMVNDNFVAPIAAYDMAFDAEKHIPGDSSLLTLWPLVSVKLSMQTIPADAEVWWKDYDQPDSEWRLAGRTPFKAVKFPRPYLRWEIRKKGFQTIQYAGVAASWKNWDDSSNLILDKEGSLPANMVRMPARETPMYIVGLEAHGGKHVGSFLMDKYEVSNKLYKSFMDAGGYNQKKYWKHSFYRDGKEINAADAMALFIDKTGRPGPAGWEAGSYADGQESFPVTGVSWYEAAAFAVFANKALPTVYHWSVGAETPRTQSIVPLSNFNGKSTTEVGSNMGYSSLGIYDIAGNAREWCYNENVKGEHYILGGGFNDQTYAFNDSYTQPALDRSIGNGFRCIRELPGDTGIATLKRPVSLAFRDYKKEKPVDDKTFELYRQQFLYDKKPLEPRIEKTQQGEAWTAEKITFDAGYSNERTEAWLYLPKGFSAPYQTVLFFPGSNDIYERVYNPASINNRIDFILKSGRAIIRPIYKGTFERHDALNSDLQDATVFYKDHVIMWSKEIARSIDYLETRKDLQADKLAYLGWSWGGFLGGIMPAIEKRIKVIVLNVGGMEMNKALPEADQINYLPRVTQPVLMLNGKYDMFFPVETAQKPMFNFLGTPKEHKKIIIYDVGHLVPRTDFVKETLLWLDKYLGPVK